MIARGELHLSGVHQLARHLTEDNYEEVLQRAKHKSMREIDPEGRPCGSRWLVELLDPVCFEDIEDVKRLRTEPTRPLKDVVRDLKRDGLL